MADVDRIRQMGPDALDTKQFYFRLDLQHHFVKAIYLEDLVGFTFQSALKIHSFEQSFRTC